MKFEEITLRIDGAVNYETPWVIFCCNKMKNALYFNKGYYYSEFGVRKVDTNEYIDSCPFCGSKGINK